jgi:hypothetical protein
LRKQKLNSNKKLKYLILPGGRAGVDPARCAIGDIHPDPPDVRPGETYGRYRQSDGERS